ncbi:chalcone isomerase-like protein [Phanerochaete sordida]|uniref:Chalcone isomerase-like protein n=1 Tax=Phanerochaete sordida TaxID=48140 RepID=A0A9P3G2C6_9APHY|nr:chalcone isomerase-like protein [Phanerochaete sordida]
MLHLLQPAVCRALASSSRTFSTTAARRALQNNNRASSSKLKPLLWTTAIAATGLLAWQSTSAIQLDAEPAQADETIDPASGIAFPNTLKIQSKAPLPTYELIGAGVRTVSFLGIRVYSIGFYADLNNPKLNISKSATPEEKIEHIIKNSSCVLRIVPTRSTSFSHLRDGFIRAIQARLVLAKKKNTLTADEELAVQSPLRKFKSMFPNTPLAKGQELDILLAPRELSQQRSLIVRDLGSVQSDWLAHEFFLAYFEGDGLSPPLKKAVVAKLTDFGN